MFSEIKFLKFAGTQSCRCPIGLLAGSAPQRRRLAPLVQPLILRSLPAEPCRCACRVARTLRGIRDSTTDLAETGWRSYDITPINPNLRFKERLKDIGFVGAKDRASAIAPPVVPLAPNPELETYVVR